MMDDRADQAISGRLAEVGIEHPVGQAGVLEYPLDRLVAGGEPLAVGQPGGVLAPNHLLPGLEVQLRHPESRKRVPHGAVRQCDLLGVHDTRDPLAVDRHRPVALDLGGQDLHAEIDGLGQHLISDQDGLRIDAGLDRRGELHVRRGLGGQLVRRDVGKRHVAERDHTERAVRVLDPDGLSHLDRTEFGQKTGKDRLQPRVDRPLLDREHLATSLARRERGRGEKVGQDTKRLTAERLDVRLGVSLP